MQIKIHDESKMVEIWLNRAEQEDPAVQANLGRLYEKYRQKKYLVAVYRSGQQDFYNNVRDLLLYNRRRCAELSVMQEKQQRPNHLLT